jgi:basic membrane protein A and related proteins
VKATRRLLWLFALLAAMLLALAAAGCGGDDGGEATPTEEATTAEEPAGADFRVGLVTDIGGLNDRGFNELANEALEQGATELGVQTRALESKSDADYIPNLSQLADEGYDLIVSNGFLMGESTEKAAAEYPDSKFAIIDFAYEAPPDNLLGLVFKEQEVGYLTGYLAAKVSKSGTVSTVGGQKIPPVDRFIAGFHAGAKAARPDIKLLNGYSQDFVDQAKCKEVALDQIAKGSDVVFQVAGGCGLGALDAAKEKGVWGVGVDKDQAFLGDHILTSAVKRVDEAVFQTIEKLVNGEFKGGVAVFDLKSDGVGLGEVSDQVDQALIDEVDQQKEMIIAGEVQIPETFE